MKNTRFCMIIEHNSGFITRLYQVFVIFNTSPPQIPTISMNITKKF